MQFTPMATVFRGGKIPKDGAPRDFAAPDRLDSGAPVRDPSSLKGRSQRRNRSPINLQAARFFLLWLRPALASSRAFTTFFCRWISPALEREEIPCLCGSPGVRVFSDLHKRRPQAQSCVSVPAWACAGATAFRRSVLPPGLGRAAIRPPPPISVPDRDRGPFVQR